MNGRLPAAGLLTLVCTKTGGEICSGVLYTRSDLSRTRRAKLLLHCRYCRKSHLFSFSDAVLKPMEQGRRAWPDGASSNPG